LIGELFRQSRHWCLLSNLPRSNDFSRSGRAEATKVATTRPTM